jgi:cytochrome P450
MAVTGPEPLSFNPLRRIAADLVGELRKPYPYPPGDKIPSVRRTHRMVQDPLPLLLDLYKRHGPVFTVRILHAPNVFMLGPEANHYVLVSHAENFRWRDGGFGDLIPLLGDGMLTIDGAFHKQSRKTMLPAFQHERIAATLETMEQEIEAAVAPWRPGDRVNIYYWARELALKIAMRALLGVRPRTGLDAAAEFERALSFYGREYWLQVMRGPLTPWATLHSSRKKLDKLIYAEVADRQRSGRRGDDVLSLLLDTELSDRHIRDHVMTLLFAGHDTTTATIAFMFRELALAPEWADRAADSAEDREMVLDETLRMYPPAWIGPRRANRSFELHGVRVPANTPVNYSSWVTHHLPDLWEAPFEFRPERFGADSKAQLPKGAYVPFGAGSRICLGMRFGQQEIRAIAKRILRDFRLELEPDQRLVIRQTPTLGPKDGLWIRVREAE